MEVLNEELEELLPTAELAELAKELGLELLDEEGLLDEELKERKQHKRWK